MDADTECTADLTIEVANLTEDTEQEEPEINNDELDTDNVAIIGENSNESCIVERTSEPCLGVNSSGSCLGEDSNELCLNEPQLSENASEIGLIESANDPCGDGSGDNLKDCPIIDGNVIIKKEAQDEDVTPDSTAIPQENILQVGAGMADGYIILSKEAAVSLGMGATENSDPSEPLPKRIRFEAEDGQSYVLTVTDSGNTELHTENKQLSQAAAVLESTSSQGIQVGGHTKKNSDNSQDVSQSWFTTRDDKMALQSKGACWKQGQWNKEEVEILQSNINNYCKEHCINDPTEIIFEMSKDERKDFYRTVAKGLQRPLFSVYRRVTRMYDQKNHMGKYSPEEMAKLRELRMKFGNDWASIGAAIGRSASSVKDKCRLMRDTCNSGKWLPEEEKRLAEAVYEFAGIKPGENVTSGLSWASVAERVATRSEKQCRTKWLNYLNWKQKGGTDWTREDDINLVLKISAFNVTDDSEIDWNDLAKNWPSVRSPQWLRGKWWSLKRHVPDYQILPFNDLLEYLKTVHLRNVHMKYPLGSNFKITKDSLPRSVVSSDMTFHIPVPLTSSSSLEGGVESEGFQAYEVLQQTNSGAYLITQPHNNPAISISGATMGTDHIIVHTLPAANLRAPEGMAVQVNPNSVIINGSTVENVTPINATHVTIESQLVKSVTPTQIDSIAIESQQDLQTLGESDQITTVETALPRSDLESQDQLESDANIISRAEEAFNSQTINGSDIVTDSEISGSGIVSTSTVQDTTDLVMVSSSSPHCVTDSKLISSLSDPMLPSGGTDLMGSSSRGTDLIGSSAGGTDLIGASTGGTDLIGSSSDVETEKGTPHDSEHDTDITSSDITES